MEAKRAPGLSTLLILGGGGLVGLQVAKRAALDLAPDRIVIAALYQKELDVLQDLSREHPSIEFRGYYGNIFLRGAPIPAETTVAVASPAERKEDSEVRRQLFADTFYDFDTAYQESMLARLIRDTRPDAIVDCVNTATGISYQDVFLASDIVARGLDELKEAVVVHSKDAHDFLQIPRTQMESFSTDLERLLISISIPELILHVRLIWRAMVEVGTQAYVKVGTTGTGGMGLNIPYTHGEDKPSPTLMTKTAVAFAQTGLLFLMARTPGGPIVKEVKPAAMIGYRDIDFMVLRGSQYRKRDGRIVLEKGQPYTLFASREVALGDELDTTPQVDEYPPLKDSEGKPQVLQLPCVNTGENGLFTRGEFEAITYTGQMEFITPEEIANDVILELRGSATGHDVIGAVDSAIMDPTYKAGMIRHVAIQELEKLEAERGTPSIALGQLGPPQLAKYLYEAHLFRVEFGTLERIAALNGGSAPAPEDLSKRFFQRLENDPLRHVITSIGIPILWPDGKHIWRGPLVKIPAYNPKRQRLPLGPETIDLYARKGWVDLRPQHLAWWVEMFRQMRATTHARGAKRSSERLTRGAYLSEEIRIGEVVAWIFNNVIDPPGHRIK